MLSLKRDFEALGMLEDETIGTYLDKISLIASEIILLEEELSGNKIVEKDTCNNTIKFFSDILKSKF